MSSQRRNSVRADPSSALAPVEVKSTRYNLVRLRLAQVLIPIGAILTPLAKRSGSWVGFGAALLVCGTALMLIASARTTSREMLGVQHGRLKLGHLSLGRDEFGRWLWLGDRAKLFLLDGNAIVEPTVRGDAGAIEAMLRTELGTPLSYIRRGSAFARGVAAFTLALGVVLAALGFANQSFIAPLGMLLVVAGGAALGALSQRVIVRGASLNQRG